MKKILQIIKALVQKPYLLNLVLEHESRYEQHVLKKFGLNNGLKTIALSKILPDAGILVSPFAALDGGSLITDLALLKALAELHKPDTYFEIGTWRGESVANVAPLANKCFTLNLSGDEMLALNLPKSYIDLHAYFSKPFPNVYHLEGHSHNFDFTDYFGKIDMVFIDGDHHYESVRKDTQTAFKLIKDKNSIIVWHDYAYQPETIRWSVLAGILDGCPKDMQHDIYHIENTLCAVYWPSLKHFEHSVLKKFMPPKHYYNVGITARVVE